MKRTRPKIFTPYPTTARGLRCCFEFKTWRSMAVERKCSFMCFLRWPTSATAKLTFPRQNLLFHGKTYFSTAKLTFPRQNLLSHGKTYFSTAKLTFPRQNLLSHGKTYFSIPSFQSVSAYAFPRRRSGNFKQSNMADGEEDYV